MSKYEIVRTPTNQQELTDTLVEFSTFLDAMYSEKDTEIFGPVSFIFDHWLFLWDTGAGYFLTKRDSAGKLVTLAMLTQFRDLWSSRPVLNVNRIAMAVYDGLDEQKEILEMLDYLKSIASLMRFDLLYYVSRDDKGNETRELVWNNKT